MVGGFVSTYRTPTERATVALFVALKMRATNGEMVDKKIAMTILKKIAYKYHGMTELTGAYGNIVQSALKKFYAWKKDVEQHSHTTKRKTLKGAWDGNLPKGIGK